MTLQFRLVDAEQYTVTPYDSDVVLSYLGQSGIVFIPEDDPRNPIPIGFQVAIQAGLRSVLVRGLGAAFVACPTAPLLRPLQVGVMVKTDANFWLLGLGSNAGGGGATPAPPILNTVTAGAGSLTAGWEAPVDPGGSPISNYSVEYSLDGQLTWKIGGLAGAEDRSFKINDLEDVLTSVRVKALNADGASDPSNVIDMTPDPPLADGAPTIAHDDGVGSWTITNYDAKYFYSAQASAGTATVTGNKVTGGEANCTIIVNVFSKPGGTALSTTVERKAYTYNYTPDRYVCTNETFDNCGSPQHPDGSYYCSCGTLGGCGNPNDCCGWVCHAGYTVPAYYTIDGGPAGAGYQSSSGIGGQYSSPPNPPPGEWFKIGV